MGLFSRLFGERKNKKILKPNNKLGKEENNLSNFYSVENESFNDHTNTIHFYEINEKKLDSEEMCLEFNHSIDRFTNTILAVKELKIATANPKRYNKKGFNVLGYSKAGLTIFDYNEDGYDVNGYNPFGYDRQGYDKNGYNKKGYNVDGYDRFHLNQEGFDRLGYDVNRFNKEGFCIIGFNNQGFDKSGFDYQGYNADGYNKDGYNRAGFNKNGVNIFGHHYDEYDMEGYLKETGYNDYGFNVNGYDKDGYNKSGFNELGYNREGFSELGFDKNGYNQEGYNYEGYNILGYDRFGYNCEGYDEKGFDHEGYNREGFNLSGYDHAGFDKYGYDIYGYDRKGFTEEENRLLNTKKTKVNDLKEGDIVYNNTLGALEIIFRSGKVFYVTGDKLSCVPRTCDMDAKAFAIQNKEMYIKSKLYGNLILFHDSYEKEKKFIYGNNFVKEVKRYTISCFESNDDRAPTLFLNMPESWLLSEDSFNIDTFKLEEEFLKKVKRYVQEEFLEKVNNTIMKNWKLKFKSDDPVYTKGYISEANYKKTAEIEFERISGQINREPYFASFILNDKKTYLGRNEIVSLPQNIHIASWTDKKIAQYYYQYDAYVGNKNNGLTLVRDYKIVHGRLFMYFDKFNSKLAQNAIDDRMTKLLQAHRNDKRVKDIINSIQKQQYEIMTEELGNELLVLGCAGSGKTMILFHRLNYLLSNYNLDINDVFLISPTNLLAVQTDQLSKILNVDKANRLTLQQFMFNIYREYCTHFNLHHTLTDIEENKNFECDARFFDSKVLQNYINQVNTRRNSIQFEDTEYRRINDAIKCVEELIINDCKIQNKEDIHNNIQDYIYLNEVSLSICKRYSIKNIELMQESLETYMEDLEENAKYLELVLLFKKNHLFTGIYTKEQQKQLKRLNSKHSLINELIMPLSKLTRGYNITDLSNLNFETPKHFIEYLIQNSKLLMNSEIADIQSYLYKIIIISEELANAMIKICKKFHVEYEMSRVHYEVLEYLKNSKHIGSEDAIKNGEVYGDDLDSFKQFNRVFELFDRFNWNREIAKKYQLTSEVRDPFDFFEMYRYLKDRNLRFNKFKSGGLSEYVFDLAFDLINPTRSIFEKTKKCRYEELFALTYILVNMYGKIENGKKIIFIDEFQDLSSNEIITINKAYPNSIFNYYGDVFQCMNMKGIHSKKEIEYLFPNSKKYEIMVNYRNAQEITTYVNNCIPHVTQMISTGLKGEVCKLIRNDNEIRHALKYNDNDRVAFVVKDKNNVEEGLMKCLDVIDITKYKSDNIPRGRVMLYSVKEAKGLEFDIVIVDDQNMNDNEKYVAYTRALNKLFIIM